MANDKLKKRAPYSRSQGKGSCAAALKAYPRPTLKKRNFGIYGGLPCYISHSFD
jgi:hypothetical protein